MRKMKRDALVTGNLKSICLFFLLLWTQFQATGYSFVRVNSGTKSDITRLSMVDENAGFFLADKLYTLNKNNSWSKANYPADHSVFQFSALATDDLWYSCSFENSTSVIYHYHQNQLTRSSVRRDTRSSVRRATRKEVVHKATRKEVGLQ